MKKNRATEAAPNQDDTKVQRINDMRKVLTYLQTHVANSLSISIDVRVMRCSITWYLDSLIKDGHIQVVGRGFDERTHSWMNLYTADKNQWKKPDSKQLDLFREEV